MQSEPECPVCMERVPNMVSACFHSLCETCVDNIFLTQRTSKCPICKRRIERHDFSKQTEADISLSKEKKIRKDLRATYNLRQTDFPSLDEYNNYLEEVEDIVWNLCNNIDVDETRKKINDFKEMNAGKIRANKARVLQEDKEMVVRLEAEKREMEAKRDKAKLEDEQERQVREAKRKEQQDMLSGVKRIDPNKSKAKAEVKARLAQGNQPTVAAEENGDGQKKVPKIKISMKSEPSAPASTGQKRVPSPTPLEGKPGVKRVKVEVKSEPEVADVAMTDVGATERANETPKAEATASELQKRMEYKPMVQAPTMMRLPQPLKVQPKREKTLEPKNREELQALLQQQSAIARAGGYLASIEAERAKKELMDSMFIFVFQTEMLSVGRG